MEPKIEAALILYKEHREHARHVERERMWIGNFYSAILIAAFSYGKGFCKCTEGIEIIILLMAISLVGFFMSIKLHIVFKSHMKASNEIMKQLIGSEQGLDNYVEHTKSTSKYNKIRISYLFPLLYGFVFSGLVLLVFYKFDLLCIGIAVGLIVLLTLVYISTRNFHPDKK